MPALVRLRSLLSMLAAGGLAACGATSARAPVSVDADTPTTIALVSRSSPMLVVGNAAGNAAGDAAAAGSPAGAVRKTVDDEALQALLDTFAVDGTFDFGVAAAPPSGNQALVLEHGDRRWYWIPGGPNDARTAAFARARSYFLQLFNHARAYVPADEDAGLLLRDSARRATVREPGSPRRQP